MANHLLSKSSFLKGIQCDKQLYLYKYHYNWMDKVSESQQAIFNRGTSVGIRAQQLFANGTTATDDPRKSDEAVVKTKALIEKGCQVIYEAAFLFDNILVISDIIVREGSKWNIYEVKSSTSISETYLLDASIQYYVLLKCGIEINDISIIYINSQYVRNGDLSIQSLFNIESVKERVLLQQEFVIREASRLKDVLKGKVIPQIPIGKQCSDPYPCSFMGYCWKDIPEYSVFDIANLKTDKKFELYNQGYIKLEDIPPNYNLNDKQWMQINCHINNEPIIDKVSIKEFLSDITYPLYFMDFETFMPAIPMFNGSKPYQQIPFQYSLHYIRDNGSTLEHFEFLADATGDPRIPFITKLLNDTRNDGIILVYNKSFEISRLKEIAQDFPEFSLEIEKRINRIADLMIPFQKRYYYTPEMKGSYSIKYVLPALVRGLSYDNLEIKEGGTASSVFESLYYETDLFRCVEIRKDLLEYCKMDTLAMVEIFKILKII